MNARTIGYLIFIGIVIILEIMMISFYIDAANEFDQYQLLNIFNFTKDNEFEGGIGLLLGSIGFQILLAVYLIFKSKR